MEQEKIGIPEFYKQYVNPKIYLGNRNKKKKTEESVQSKVDRHTFSNILKDCNLELARQLLEENLIFTMPFNLGTIYIRKYKKKLRFNEDGTIDTRKLNVDWKATKDYWAEQYPGLSMEELKEIPNKVRIFHLNEHTDNFIVRLYWRKHSAITNKRVYSLFLTRTNKRRIAELLKTNPNINYYE